MKIPEVKWLVEDYVFSEDITPIVNEIKYQNMEVNVVKYKPFESEEFNQYKEDDCVIVLGSINLIKQIQRQKPWIPGTFANFHNFDCMTYYGYYGKYLLNDSYSMMPLGDMIRRLEIEEDFSDKDDLFFRPCSGAKTFSGQKVDLKTIKANMGAYGKPETPIVLSDFTNDLKSEYRLFCTKENVIGGSMYYDYQGVYNTKNIQLSFNTMNGLSEDESDSILAVNFAKKILEETQWIPDKIFVMDIGILKSDVDINSGLYTKQYIPKLIEINSFSCSGWYKTDPENIIKEASRLAIEDWIEINNI